MLKVKKIEKSRVFDVEFEHEGESHTLKFTMKRPKSNEFFDIMSKDTLSLAQARQEGEEVDYSVALAASKASVDFTISKIAKVEGAAHEDGSAIKQSEFEYVLPFFVLQNLSNLYIPWAVECLTGLGEGDKKKEIDSKDSKNSSKAA